MWQFKNVINLNETQTVFGNKQHQTANVCPQKSVNIFVYVYRYLNIKCLVASQRRNKFERKKKQFSIKNDVRFTETLAVTIRKAIAYHETLAGTIRKAIREGLFGGVSGGVSGVFQGVSRCFLYLFSKRGLEQSIAVTTHGSIWEVFLAHPNDPIIILTPNQSRGRGGGWPGASPPPPRETQDLPLLEF